MRILTKFLIRRFFAGFGIVMLTVCGVVFAVTFIERMPSNPTVMLAAGDAFARLLEYMPIFLPLAVFMGTLLASYNLIKSSENVIVSGAGLSPYQSARPFLIGAFALGLSMTMAVNPYSVNLSAKHITTEDMTLVDGAVWLREASGDSIITVRAPIVKLINGNDMRLRNATVFVQDTDFKIRERVQANEILLSGDGLSADTATVWDASGAMRTQSWRADTLLNPQTVLDRYLNPGQISFWQLPGFIDKMTKIGVPVQSHLVQFWTLLFMPLTLAAMTALGVAFSQTRQRRNYNFGIKFAIGIVTCFALYFVVNVMGALGATGTLPALLAVMAPPLIIIAGAGAFIATFDTI